MKILINFIILIMCLSLISTSMLSLMGKVESPKVDFSLFHSKPDILSDHRGGVYLGQSMQRFDPAPGDTPKQLETKARIKAQVEQRSINLGGGPTIEDQRNAENDASLRPTSDLISAGFSSFNSVVGVGQLLERKGIAADPTFNLTNSWQELTDGVPGEYHGEFLGIESKEEGYLLKKQIQEDLSNKELLSAAGYRGVLALALARVLDMPTVLAVMVLYYFWINITEKIMKSNIQKLQLNLSQTINKTRNRNANPVRQSVLSSKNETVGSPVVEGDDAGKVGQMEEEKVIESKGVTELDRFFGDAKCLISSSLPWSDRTVLEKSYTCLFILIVIALFPMPYAFYSSLRVMICIGLYFYFQAILPERLSKGKWFWIVIGLFVIYNPIVPLRIGNPSIWTLINFITIYILYRARLVFDKKEV